MKLLQFFLITLLSVLVLSTVLFAQPSINVDDPNLMKQAIDFCNIQDAYDTIILTVPGGVYTTHDTIFYEIKKPLTIKAADGLAEMPIITHSDDSTDVLEMFRIYTDLTVEGVIFDGGNEFTHGMKYALRVGNSEDGSVMAKKGLNITLRNCVFRNIAQDKDPLGEGHALYFLKEINTVGKVLIENCHFENISDEAIRMTETEKYKTERCLDSLIVRNCTFEKVEAECIRFYADTDDNTPDAYVLLENLTVNNSATRVAYIKNNWGTIMRNVVITNSHLSVRRSDRNDFTVQLQKPTSVLSNIDTLNMAYSVRHPSGTLAVTKGGDEDAATIWGFDPLYADAANGDYTLLPGSHAYYAAHDGGAIGDLRWAINTPTVIPFNYEIVGNGKVMFNPPLDGQSYDPGTVVTMTADPDSAWEFTGWSGDVTSSNNPETVTVDAAKSITATFQETSTAVDDIVELPTTYQLEQNFPNPFNPSTTISFSLKNTGFTTLKIYNVLGTEIKTMIKKQMDAGNHTITFQASDLPTGVYFYEITSGNFVARKKMILMR